MNNNNKKKNRVATAGRPVRSRGGPDRSAISPEGVYCNARFMQAITLHIGDKVTVYTVHGKQFEGYLKTFSKQLELVISMTHQVDPENPQVIDPNTVVDMKIFKLDDIVRIEAKNVDLEYAVRDTFATDTAISKFNGVLGERELEPWAEDNLGTGDDFDLDQMCNHNVGTSTNGWDVNDMFKKNETVYGVQSTFDQSLSGYTVQIQKRDTVEFKEAEARAAAIANEIENNPTYRARVELENGDEEDRFAAVTRPGESTAAENGKYVPPAKRSHAPSTGKLMPRTISSGSSSSGGPPTPTPPLSRQDSGPQPVPPVENKPASSPSSQHSVSQDTRHHSSSSDRHSSSSDRQYSSGPQQQQDIRPSHHSHHSSNSHHHSHSSQERNDRQQHSDSRQDRHMLERQDSRHSQDSRHERHDRQDSSNNIRHQDRHNSERHNQDRHNSERDRSQGGKYHQQNQNYHHNQHHTPPFPPPSLGYSGGPPPQTQSRGVDSKPLPPQHRIPPGQTMRNGTRGPRSSYSESTAPNALPLNHHGPPQPRYGQPQPPPEHIKRAHHPPPPHPSMMIVPPNTFPGAPPLSHQAPPPASIVPNEAPPPAQQQRKSPAAPPPQQPPPGPPPSSSPHEQIQLQNTQQYPALPTPGTHYHHQQHHHSQQQQPQQQQHTQQHVSPPPQQQGGVANTRQSIPSTHQAPPPAHHTHQQQPLPQRKPRGRDDQISELKKFGSDFKLAESAAPTTAPPAQHVSLVQSAKPITEPVQTKTNMVERSTSPPPPPQQAAQPSPPPSSQAQEPTPSASPPKEATPPASLTPPSGGDKVSVTLKTSKLNPNAKEFKPFTPRAPSTPTPSRPHTPQTPSYAPQPQQQVPQPTPQPQGPTPLPMVIASYVPTMVTSQPQPPPPSRYRKSTGGVPVNISHRSDIQQQMQVAAATGPPLLATAPMHTQFTVPYTPQAHLAASQGQYQQMVRMGGAGMVPIVHAYPHESPAPPGPQYMSPHPHPHPHQHAPTVPSPNTMQGGAPASQQQNNQGGPTPPHHHYPSPGVPGAPQNPPGAYQQAPPPSIMYHPLMPAPPHNPHMIAAAQNSAMQQYLHQHHQAMGAMAGQHQQHIQVILPHTQ